MTPDPDPFSPENLRLTDDVLAGMAGSAKPGKRAPRHKRGERFLWGPVPLTWLASAGALPGRALHVGVVLWWLAGLRRQRTDTVPWRPSIGKLFGLDRHATHRALKTLEAAGLVRVDRQAGRCPLVTILHKETHHADEAET
jgi:hypothetical protein